MAQALTAGFSLLAIWMLVRLFWLLFAPAAAIATGATGNLPRPAVQPGTESVSISPYHLFGIFIEGLHKSIFHFLSQVGTFLWSVNIFRAKPFRDVMLVLGRIKAYFKSYIGIFYLHQQIKRETLIKFNCIIIAYLSGKPAFNPA